MISKSGVKFEEKLVLCFKNHKNLVNFYPSIKRSKRLHLDWSLIYCKVYNVWPKKVQKSWYFTTPKSHAKFEEKLTCGLENDMRNLANFHQNTWKCQILYKLENPWAYREVLSYDKSEWWKIWKGIDLSFQNGHKEFDSRTRKSQKLKL